MRISDWSSDVCSSDLDLFDGWAGPISFATGGEYRKISTNVTSDPLSQVFPADYVAATAPGIRGLPGSVGNAPNPGVGRFGNFQPLSGSFNVKEAFVELNVPLLRDEIGRASCRERVCPYV